MFWRADQFLMEEAPLQELHRKQYKRLKPDEIAEAARLRAEGIAVAALAQQFEISERQLHRVLKNQMAGPPIGNPFIQKGKHGQSSLQEHHSAWINEELLSDPHVTLDYLASGLAAYFGVNVSTSTIWRHIKGGGMEAQGFPGHTRPVDEQLEQ